MAQFNIPHRQYCKGEKKLISMRLPEKLLKELDRLADQKGWSFTDLVSTVLDQYVQSERKPERR